MTLRRPSRSAFGLGPILQAPIIGKAPSSSTTVPTRKGERCGRFSWKIWNLDREGGSISLEISYFASFWRNGLLFTSTGDSEDDEPWLSPLEEVRALSRGRKTSCSASPLSAWGGGKYRGRESLRNSSNRDLQVPVFKNSWTLRQLIWTNWRLKW